MADLGDSPTLNPSQDYGNAIAGIESGGKYGILGPVTQSGDRAYGKYQVMGANVGPWTKEVLGAPMSPQQFLASPQAQDAVFQAKFGQYVQKYGPEGAARAWFAGPGGMNNLNAKDVNGMTVGRYGQRFGQLLNGPQQSYNTAPTPAQGSGDGNSGQAARMESSYNSAPYNANNGNSPSLPASQPSQTNWPAGTSGTIGNTGSPQANSQAELVGQGGRGWNIYQTTPTWTGSPNSQSPPARSEGDFQAPALSGPQNPILQRQQQLRQLLIARAFQNMPRGYQFTLG